MYRSIFVFIIMLMLCFGCQSEQETLPVLSFKINSEGVKDYYTVSYTGFVNQFNQEFTTENLKGKICLANFFFIRCPSICPPMQQELIKVANALKAHEDFMIISHTIDMTHDTVNELHSYWENTGIPATTWQFLRANDSITQAQANQFMTHFKPHEDGTDFYHSSMVTLIDTQQQIRGFYNTTLPVDMERLIKDIKRLID